MEARISLKDIGSYARSTWDLMHAKPGMSQDYKGRAGRVVKTTMKENALRASPQLGTLSKADLELVVKEIGSVLKQTGNAKCLESNPRRTPVWWVSNEYTATAILPGRMKRVPVGEGGRQDPKAEAERRLTPHEAGEDREPAPVEVRSESWDGRVLAILRKYPEPLCNHEVAAELGDLVPAGTKSKNAKLPQAGGRTVRSLEHLVKSGNVLTRIETAAERSARGGKGPGVYAQGRPSRLFFAAPGPMPERVTRQLVPNFVLEVNDMDLDAGRRANAQKVNVRNDTVLNALIDAGQPASTSYLMETTGLSKHQVEDALRSFARNGIAHRGPMKRTGREWLPIDVSFPDPKSKSTPSSSSPSPKETPRMIESPPDTPAQRAIVRAALDMAAQGKDFTSRELANDTRYSTSLCSEVLREQPILFKRTGAIRQRCVVYEAINAEKPVEPSLTETQPVPATPPQIDEGREIIRAAAAAMGLLTDDSARVQELEARIVELEESNTKLRKALDAALS